MAYQNSKTGDWYEEKHVKNGKTHFRKKLPRCKSCGGTHPSGVVHDDKPEDFKTRKKGDKLI